MGTTVLNRFESKLTPSPHPYLNGAWTPQTEEVQATDLTVIGDIPKDLNGLYVRNTENPLFDAIGVYHPFDGDGMIHAMRFERGTARYTNRFVRTAGFLAEQAAGRSLWTGIAGNPAKSERDGWGARGRMKDASSTDVVVHGGRVLSTHYMCGEGYLLDPETLDTLGTADWVPEVGISAHPKVDPVSGDLLFFNYGKEAPYMHYGVVGADQQLKHYIPIPLPGPRLPHDMAFSRNYSILIDLPLFWDPELLERGIHVNRYYPNLPTRFAVVPRFGSEQEIRWFEADPTYVLHWMNAWEDGDELILDGYFQEQPDPAPVEIPGVDIRFGKLLANIDEASFKPRLHRWRFNLKTGKTTEAHLDERTLEFGSFDQRRAGERSRYLYSTTTEPGWFLFNGLVKHDFESGDGQSYHFGEQRYASEAPFAPRTGSRAEDDGFLVSFVTDLKADQSECVVLNAQAIDEGPVCRIILPHRISSGTHATWAGVDELPA
ncbi:MAG: carotenoid oxygenase family protein [Pseudomonadota bacterium]